VIKTLYGKNSRILFNRLQWWRLHTSTAVPIMHFILNGTEMKQSESIGHLVKLSFVVY